MKFCSSKEGFNTNIENFAETYENLQRYQNESIQIQKQLLNELVEKTTEYDSIQKNITAVRLHAIDNMDLIVGFLFLTNYKICKILKKCSHSV